MRRVLTLLVPLALAVPTARAATPSPRPAPTAEQTRIEVRKAVEAHRAQERDDIRRQEAEIGRRLTPAERAELREQVRYQWLLPSKAQGSAGKLEGTSLTPSAPGTPPSAPAPGTAPGTRGFAP